MSESSERSETAPAAIDRRTALGRIATVTAAGAALATGGVTLAGCEAQRTPPHADHKPEAGGRPAAEDREPFFSTHEMATLTSLVDLIIPKDARSGSASEAGVPAFIDYMMVEANDTNKAKMKGGLAWSDREARRRFDGRDFVAITPDQQKQILNDIAWPDKAGPAFVQAASWFSYLRDMTASGFYSSKIGIADLGYQGNVPVAEWKGSSPEWMAKVGVSLPVVQPKA
jgi:gluconate 2-dehydrogenase gamma chain